MAYKTVNLRCNHLVNPLGIDDPAPRFSWQIVSEERAVLQSAYQLQVSDASGALLWDTNKVGSLRSQYVPYAGPPLASAARYYWRVAAVPSRHPRRLSAEPGSRWSFARRLARLLGAAARARRPCTAKLLPVPLPRVRGVRGWLQRGLYRARPYEARLNGAVVGDQLPLCLPP